MWPKQEICDESISHIDEFCGRYKTVIIDRSQLPLAGTVDPHEPALTWISQSDQLEAREGSISRNVASNLLDRHIQSRFLHGGSCIAVPAWRFLHGGSCRGHIPFLYAKR